MNDLLNRYLDEKYKRSPLGMRKFSKGMCPANGGLGLGSHSLGKVAWGSQVIGQSQGSLPASIIAATALSRQMTLVTRNVRDFVASGASVLNPWTPE